MKNNSGILFWDNYVIDKKCNLEYIFNLRKMIGGD